MYVLGYSGVRGAEVLSHSKDDREGRNGLRWENVDLDAGTMLVSGKNQTWERTPLPSKCLPALYDFNTTLASGDEQWPAFPSGHRPSLYEEARAVLGDRFDHRLATEKGDIWQLFRAEGISPPPLTTSGARSVMQQLMGEANLDVDGEYLKLHGGRRGLGDLLYRIDRDTRRTFFDMRTSRRHRKRISISAPKNAANNSTATSKTPMSRPEAAINPAAVEAGDEGRLNTQDGLP